MTDIPIPVMVSNMSRTGIRDWYGSKPNAVMVFLISIHRYECRYIGPVGISVQPVYRSNRYAHSQNEFLCILTGMVTGMSVFFMIKVGIPMTIGNPEFPTQLHSTHTHQNTTYTLKMLTKHIQHILNAQTYLLQHL